MRNHKYAPLNSRLLRAAAIVALCAIGLGASAGQRPITDFIENQGTVAPGNFIAWEDEALNTFVLDYAGVWNNFFDLGLPTTFDGSIDEKPLADGTAEVSVILHTHNAFTFVYGPPPFGFVLFGNDPFAVIFFGEAPALGDSTLQVKFINPGGVGAPLPDLLEVQTISFIAFTAQATGTLPDGTLTDAHTRQTGLWRQTQSQSQ